MPFESLTRRLPAFAHVTIAQVSAAFSFVGDVIEVVVRYRSYEKTAVAIARLYTIVDALEEYSDAERRITDAERAAAGYAALALLSTGLLAISAEAALLWFLV